MRVIIIKQANNVRSKINGFVKLTAKVRDEMQSLAANTLYHAAKHGDASLLNEFYKALSAGDKASFKRWVVNEVAKVYAADVKLSDMFIGMSKDQFHVKKDTMDKRVDFTNLVDDLLKDEAQADEYGKFFAIDPDKVKNPFNTATLLAQLQNLVKKTEREDAQVDPEAAKILKEMVADFSKKTKPIVDAETAHTTIQ